MPITKPYRRTCRQLVDGSYAHSGNGRYVSHGLYASSPESFVRAFLIIQRDLQELFDFIEPADVNSATYSHRTHQLLLRTCIEVEANCKAILVENGYHDNGHLNILDYKKIETSHRLSAYEVIIPYWRGTQNIRRPFQPWATTAPQLPWYNAYNQTKHDRHTNFHLASFDNLLDAVCGLVALLSSQFLNEDFGPADPYLSVGSAGGGGTESAIGNYFRIRFPTDWAPNERYDFDWQTLQHDPDPVQSFHYPP